VLNYQHFVITTEIIQTYPIGLDKNMPLPVQQACSSFLGEASCTCKGDCSKISRCSCIKQLAFLNLSFSPRKCMKREVDVI
jgi:hypothetical protein